MQWDNQIRVNRLSELTARSRHCFDILPIGNLTLNEISSLLTIFKGQQEKGESLNMSEAGEMLNLGRSAMSQLVARLERKGMLRREIVPFDRRKTLIMLSAKTKKIVEDIRIKRTNRLVRAIEILGEDEADKFIELYQKYIEAIEVDENA